MNELFAELGFTLPQDSAFRKLRRRGHRDAMLRPLLYFVEAYFDKSNSEINQKLRRRLHWLAE